MDELIYYNELFDYYGELLTEKQKEYFKYYYFDNLSLSEIAEENNISRNAVSKTLKEVKEKLDNYESILNLYSNKNKIKEMISTKEFNKIEKYL